jgi:hypothetical protein
LNNLTFSKNLFFGLETKVEGLEIFFFDLEIEIRKGEKMFQGEGG